MKTYTAIIAALLFTGGSASALAVNGASTDANQSGTQDFSTIDRDGDGYIDQQDAEDAGISQREFEGMNESGDGRVSEEEYRDFQDSQDNGMNDQPGAAYPQDSEPGTPGDMQPEGERGMPGQERDGLPGTEPGVPGTEPEGQPGTEPGVPGTQPQGESGIPGQQPGQQPGVPPQTPQQPGGVPGDVESGTQP